VFQASGGLTCFLRAVGGIFAIVVLLILAWIPSILCLIKQIVFRIGHCGEGNSDPCIEL
jgi:hypothetical protein